jgi:hypothetical protein
MSEPTSVGKRGRPRSKLTDEEKRERKREYNRRYNESQKGKDGIRRRYNKTKQEYAEMKEKLAKLNDILSVNNVAILTQ